MLWNQFPGRQNNRPGSALFEADTRLDATVRAHQREDIDAEAALAQHLVQQRVSVQPRPHAAQYSE